MMVKYSGCLKVLLMAVDLLKAETTADLLSTCSTLKYHQRMNNQFLFSHSYLRVTNRYALASLLLCTNLNS